VATKKIVPETRMRNLGRRVGTLARCFLGQSRQAGRSARSSKAIGSARSGSPPNCQHSAHVMCNRGGVARVAGVTAIR
jgi:hypothetical protein